MSMLNFKYGTVANLPTLGNDTLGTVYVTTDEKAMYVDLPSGSDGTAERIRLSQIRVYENVQDWKQQTAPPYPTDTFYYIANANALIKYDGTKWVQINSIEEIRTTLSNLADAVAALEENLETLSQTVSEEVAKIASISDRVSTTEEDISNLSIVTGYVKAKPDSPKEGDIWVGVNGDISIYTKDADAETFSWKTSKKNLSARIEELKAQIIAVDGGAGSAADVDQLKSDLAALQGVVNHTDTGLVKTYEIAMAAKSKADTAVQTTDFNAFKETNTPAINEAKKAGDDAQDALDAYIADNNAVITEIKNGTTINDFKTVETELAKKATTNALNNAINGLRGEDTPGKTVKGAYDAVDALKGGSTSKTVADNAADIAALTSSLDDLDDKLTTELQIADAMVYKGTITTAAGLPTSGVHIGDTYKLTAEAAKNTFPSNTQWGTESSDSSVYVGDIFIATGTESSGVITAGTLKWDHIPSGYNAEYVPELTASATNGSASIKLTSAHAGDGIYGDLGNLSITKASNSAITISAGAANEIKIGMEWMTF